VSNGQFTEKFMNISKLTIVEARRALDAKEYSALELTDAYLAAIEKKNPEIHAYLEVWEQAAREEAKKADEKISRGESKSLTGIPFAVKDNILIEGRTVSAGSKMLENYTASYDATVIAKLKGHGVVFLGRTNMDEFAMGSSTENSSFGPTKNPRDMERVPGGSSGGSAAAVAGDIALASLGSDTGGSIRQPASLTGLVGLKPTYGAVSRLGLIAMGSSLDQIGPLAKTVDDSRVIFEAVCGNDKNDSTTLPSRVPDHSDTVSGKNPKKIGVPRTFLAKGLDSDVLAKFEETLSRLEKSGYVVKEVDLPSLPSALAVYYIVMPAESSTNLARFDGVRYGLSVPAPTIQEVYAKTRGEGFGPEVRRRILVGTFVLSSGYADAYYRKARDVREVIRADFTRAFKSVDAVVTPTTPGPAFKFGEKSDPLAMYAEDIFSVPANLAGVPALSVPMGTVERNGKDLPVGFQIIGAHGDEETLFTIGKEVERV
jgi:aspartyl-tRNA(Asn)/glutamyl-tRNA(Gln) amidotransferase subunit A